MSLYFRYGVMSSGKSTQLLQICHDYEKNNNKKVWVLKPAVDVKADSYVVTRMGDGEFKRKCDFLISPNTNLYNIICLTEQEPDVILVDESQFLTKENVEDMVRVTTKTDIPIICFGLKVTFDGKPFEGSSWLFALSQDVEEITTRALSRLGNNSKRGTMNLRLVDGKPTFEGDTVAIDGEQTVSYVPVSLSAFMECKEDWEHERTLSEIYASQIDYRGGLVNDK